MFGLAIRKDGSPLEFPILLLLRQGGLHGYDLLEKLNALCDDLWTATPGTVYPVLTKMRKKKLLRETRVKSPSGPAKKVYSVTAEGERVLQATLVEALQAEAVFMQNYCSLLSRVVDFSGEFDPLFEFLDLFTGAHLETRADSGSEKNPAMEPPESHLRIVTHYNRLLAYVLPEIRDLVE